MAGQSNSRHSWRRDQAKDPYFARALREGWRSRAVFKLDEIQARQHILCSGLTCVDLGASPGGWSQYIVRKVGPRGQVWALDMRPMEPVPGVTFIQGDFNSPEIFERLKDTLAGAAIDLVMSDMAPNISGNWSHDQPRALNLAEGALTFAKKVLNPGGNFLVKLFQGEGFESYIDTVRPKFDTVRILKPKASRPESREVYLLARGYGM
mgnify:CR=1 FL=1